MTKRIVCLGEMLLRLAPPSGELLLQSAQLRATFAGAEANVAVALAAFGNDARMLTVVPDNALGQTAIAELRRHGVATSGIKVAPGRLGIFFYTPGAVRRPSEILYDRADSSFAAAPELCAEPQALDGADWFHVSGVTPALNRSCANAAIAMARAARERGLGVSFDGNYRSKLWEPWRNEAPAILRQLFETADLVFGDERDISLVLGRSFDGMNTAAPAAFAAFPRLKRIAYTTRAQHAVDQMDYGARLHTRATVHTLPPAALAGIVDRIGTGDAFAAGVIHGVVTGLSDDDALSFGHAAACLKHSVFGDYFPFGAGAVRAAMTATTLDVKR